MARQHARPSATAIWSVAARHGQLVLAPILLFLLLACVRLDLPGLHYDEALEGSLPAAQLLAGQPITALNGVALHIGGVAFPLMVQNHIGATQIYAALPFIWLLGPTAVALRSMTVLVGALTIIASYAFVVQLWGRTAAFYTALWLASFGSFIFWSRQGVFVTTLAPFFAICAMALGVAWYRNPRPRLLGVVGLCVGLAAYSKVSALWLLNGAVLWAIIALNRRLPALAVEWISKRWRELIVLVLGLLLGTWPFILYNIRSGWASVRVVQESADRTYLGISNADVLGNLRIRIEQLADVLRSGEHLWYLGGTFPSTLALASVIVALLVLLLDSALTRERDWRITLFVPFLLLAALLQSCFTISSLWYTHFAIVVMLPAIIFGSAVQRLQRWVQRTPSFLSQAAYTAMLLLAALTFLSQLRSSINYLDTTIATGGRSFHSAAIYDVARFLRDQPEPIVALDWGISTSVEYLNGARKPIKEIYGYDQAPPPDFAELLQPAFDEGALFVTHAENQEAFQRRAAFLEIVAQAGMWAEPINVSIDSNGWPMYEVWRVHRP